MTRESLIYADARPASMRRRRPSLAGAAIVTAPIARGARLQCAAMTAALARSLTSSDHYENFPVASILVPARLRPAIVALYRFARHADDLADEGDASAGERLAALDALGRELRAEQPDSPVVARLRPHWSAHALLVFAAERELTMVQVSLGWLIAQEGVPSVTAGATRPEQVRANAAAADWIPGDDDLAELARLLG